MTPLRTSHSAHEAAVEFLRTLTSTDTGDLVLLADLVEEFEVGWVYGYQSERYIATGDHAHALAGNGPVFVPRNGAEVVAISYHRPAQESMAAFACCGDANAPQRPEVLLHGWVSGAMKGSAVQALRSQTTLGLGAAKAIIDQCLNGEAPRVVTQDASSARALAMTMKTLGFQARVTYGLESPTASGAS